MPLSLSHSLVLLHLVAFPFNQCQTSAEGEGAAGEKPGDRLTKDDQWVWGMKGLEMAHKGMVAH